MQAALTQELTLIQGPPGTGKTFVGVQIMRILLANTRPLRSPSPPKDNQLVALQPILVVCLTNHALDQFLEALMDAGVAGIVRVGGRCFGLNLSFASVSNMPHQHRLGCIMHAAKAHVMQRLLSLPAGV